VINEDKRIWFKIAEKADDGICFFAEKGTILREADVSLPMMVYLCSLYKQNAVIFTIALRGSDIDGEKIKGIANKKQIFNYAINTACWGIIKCYPTPHDLTLNSIFDLPYCVEAEEFRVKQNLIILVLWGEELQKNHILTGGADMRAAK